jgi:predicted metal-dependent hydrolase
MRTIVAGSLTSEQIEICWGERRVIAELCRTDRRALRIDVRPTGEVAIFAPAGEEIDEIQSRARRKGAWIFAQIDTIAQRPKVTPKRRFISGETHLLLGRQYRLSIEQSDDPHDRRSAPLQAAPSGILYVDGPSDISATVRGRGRAIRSQRPKAAFSRYPVHVEAMGELHPWRAGGA